jgi:predicted ATPase
MQEELHRYGGKLQAEGRPPLEIRVGVNTGEVVVRSIATGATQVEYTPIGHTTNLASRLQSVARTGSIVASEATRNFCEGYFVLKPLGATKVKGVSEPVNVYEVTGLGPLRTRLQRSAGRGYTKFVGRNREMDALKAAAEQAKAGHGQIVAAMAEPGVGKSRLLFEFKAVSQSGWMVLETFSVSHGKASAFLPAIDLLQGYFHITGDDDGRARREKITGRVLALERSLEDALPYLYALLGLIEADDPLMQMSAEIRKRRTLDAIKRILIRESLNQPLMVIFEDLHWIDEGTQDFLNLLADSIGTAKILLLVNYRPEYSHQWGSKTYYTQLRLDPLGKESADEMLQSLLGDRGELGPLKRMIIEKTEGNPFFMEETVEVLFDDGALIRDGSIKLVKPLAELKIPPTVQAILVSRIDRLPPAEKDLLQTLAVIGREFAFGLVQRVVAKSEDELDRILHDLQLAEFIYEQPTAGDIEYIFKHAQTQEVAYNSVLVDRRKLLHERIGAALESLYADSLNDHLAELAHHYSKSHNVAKAILYLRLAGAQAAHRAANREAVTYFRSALDLVASLPTRSAYAEEELGVLVALGPALMTTMTSSAPEVREVYDRARELAADTHKLAELFASVWGSWLVAASSGDTVAMRKFSDELFSIARGQQDTGFLLQAHHAAVSSASYSGDLRTVNEHNEAVVAIYRKDVHRQHAVLYGGHDPAVCAYGGSAYHLQILGYPERSLVQLSKGFTLARELEHPPSMVMAFWHGADTNFQRRDPRMVIQIVEEWLPLVSLHGSAVGIANAMMYRGWALIMSGQREAGFAELRDGLGRFRATGSKIEVPFRLGRAAEAFQIGGQTDESLALVSDAFQAIDLFGDHSYEAELHRIKGSLLLELGGDRRHEAEACLERALELSRAQSARLYELRATMSLARMLAEQGRREEARAMLAEIYNWFTEGLDTADMKDAKALLDELNA